MTVSFIQQTDLHEIGLAIKQGDAHELASYFDKQIDLTFSDKTATYSKTQAEFVLRNFFVKTEPSAFSELQRGISPSNNTRFLIGHMNSSNGIYKVYLFFIQKKGQHFRKIMKT